MEKLIDLSQKIVDAIPVFPGDIQTSLFQTKNLSVDHYNDHRLETGMHTGTHIDGPMHLTESREYISDLPLESFIGQGCLLNVRGQASIGMRDEYNTLVPECSIVLLYTGFEDIFGTTEYFNNYPVVETGLARFFIEKKIKILGMDTPSPDQFPYEIHKDLLSAGIYIIENLTNLAKLVGQKYFEITALPLKIKANSSPARVVARAN